jgi:uncharacterized delta-60 repeat protein
MFSRRTFLRALPVTALLLAQVPLSPLAGATPGGLDTAFGGDGKVKAAPARRGGLANAVAIQADGRIVVAGQSVGSKPKFAVVRYNTDGTLDTTFGGDGKVITNFAKGNDQGNAVAIQADGKIVVAGGSGNGGANPTFALARYNSDGTLDTTLDGDGRVTTDFTDGFDAASAVAIQGDGKIVAAGQSGDGAEFAVARYNTDGALDSTFDGDGKVTTDFTDGFETANAVAIQGDEKIIAAGHASGGPALARYNTDGTPDSTFGGDGRVLPEVACCAVVSVYDATLQPDGKIVTAGEWFECFGAGDCGANLMVVRYNTDGTLDTSFSSDGVAFGICGRANALAIQADGKIVAAGVVDCGSLPGKSQGDFLLARYDTDGTRDGTFGKRGRVLTSFTRNWDEAMGVGIQADGKIVAGGGGAVSGPHPKFAVARYLPS